MLKFKKAIAVMLSAVMMLTAGSMPIAVNAATVENSSAVAEQTGTYNDFSYSITEQKVTITGYTGTETEIEIPSEINGCPVTRIGDYAFEKSAVTNVILPDTVEYIGQYAFSESELINIEIPDSVTYISMYAFRRSKIEKIVIPDSVTYLGSGAFIYCSNLTDVTLSNNISSIESGLLFYCESLTKVVIPNSVNFLGEAAFEYCDNLEEIILSDNIEVIPERYFEYFRSLKKVKLPDNLKKIEAYAFHNCVNLLEIKIPDKVTTIETWAFYNCPKIKSVTLPKGIQEMAGAGFGIYVVDDVYFRTGKVEGFKIAGYRGTAAEEYANYYGFIFEDLTYIPMGDVNLDEDVSVLDVTMLQRYCTSTIELTDKQLSYADVDDNGSIDINDVTAIQRLIADHYAHI